MGIDWKLASLQAYLPPGCLATLMLRQQRIANITQLGTDRSQNDGSEVYKTKILIKQLDCYVKVNKADENTKFK